jgi:hypothetical protein
MEEPAGRASSTVLRERPLSVPFLAAVALMLALKILFDLQPHDFPLRDQASAFAWPAVLMALGLAVAGRFAERSLGWPQFSPDGTFARAGLLYASIAGAVYGLITIAQFSVTQGGHPLANSAWVHVPLPWSVPFYTYGTLFLEFMLRLGFLTIFTWVLYVVLLRRRLPNTIFWSVNVLVSLFEIWPFLARDIQQNDWLSVVATPIEPLFLSNVYEGWLLRRYGWLAPIVFRAVFYLLWHVLFGGMAKPLFINEGA